MSYTYLSDKWVVVRKDRQCFGCAEIYPVGTKMHYQAGVFEGDFQAEYMCATCYDVMKHMDHSDLEDGFEFGSLFEGWPDSPEKETIQNRRNLEYDRKRVARYLELGIKVPEGLQHLIAGVQP